MFLIRKPGCLSCGHQNKRDTKYCYICGADLAAGIQSSFLNDEKLAEKLQTMHKKRLTAICILAAAVLLSFVAMITAVYGGVVLLLLTIPAIIICTLHISSKSQYIRKLFKFNIVHGALHEIFELERFAPDSYIPHSILRKSGLIDGWNEAEGSDYVKGLYHGSEISFSDITLTDVRRTTDSKGNTSETRTVRFKGQWLICALGKEISHTLRLRENREKLFGKGYKKVKSSVETENAAFNAKFQILTDDPHTAFYILTPHFMEYINSADAVANGKTYLCFQESSVHFAVGNDHDLFKFQGSPFGVLDITAQRARIKSEIKFITDIIDELMLNKYLFGKEE